MTSTAEGVTLPKSAKSKMVPPTRIELVIFAFNACKGFALLVVYKCDALLLPRHVSLLSDSLPVFLTSSRFVQTKWNPGGRRCDAVLVAHNRVGLIGLHLVKPLKQTHRHVSCLR